MSKVIFIQIYDILVARFLMETTNKTPKNRELELL